MSLCIQSLVPLLSLYFGVLLVRRAFLRPGKWNCSARPVWVCCLHEAPATASALPDLTLFSPGCNTVLPYALLFPVCLCWFPQGSRGKNNIFDLYICMAHSNVLTDWNAKRYTHLINLWALWEMFKRVLSYLGSKWEFPLCFHTCTRLN